MARRLKQPGGLAGLIDSDSEPDLGGFEAVMSGNHARSATASKRAIIRPGTTNRVTKSVISSARTHQRASSTVSRSPERRALAQKSHPNITKISVKSDKPWKKDDLMALSNSSDDDLDWQLPTKPVPTRKTQAIPPPVKSHATISSSSQQAIAQAKSNQTQKAHSVYHDEIPAPEDDDDEDMVDIVGEEMTTKPIRAPSPPKVTRSEPDMEKEALQRKLRDLSKKYQELEAHHLQLKEVGIKAAEENYDRLRKQVDESAAVSSKLIAQLKQELKIQAAAAAEVEEFQRKFEESERNSKGLLTKIADLTSSLTDAEREIKSLNTKLSASRSAEAQTKVPGSANKFNNTNKNWTGQSELVHAAHAKEDMYSDLTGLIIRGMKQEGNDEVFDCLQSGRNGTLHFKLLLHKGDGSTKYDEMEVTYSAQLQPGRDQELMSIMPDFLLDDIKFPRPHLSKFYARVLKSLTERR